MEFGLKDLIGMFFVNPAIGGATLWITKKNLIGKHNMLKAKIPQVQMP